ncbi:MAG: ribonuclease HII [Methylococcales symbiont of Hymedesmia sp. n. MRB-2018]|nr:MAG: ribonuclease HII [Methylococcales symbiont of Hymedesmia sp. n. MRB-2018]KAF3983504.1 MAG: ribonuclease HII [Methylococcales symbiont of Hymedesmia sp. n. MRB-2018]
MSTQTCVIAGIDEVGRGCIVGSVIAAAVVLNADQAITGLTDSKKLTAKKRQNYAVEIKEKSRAWAIGRAEPSEIDQLNILQATLLAMRRAYSQLSVKTDWVQVDGTFYPDIPCPGETIVQGDSKIAKISAASILAKVARDEEMSTMDLLYPSYEFSKHKGYPTKLHLERLKLLGATEQHRKSFSPVAKQLILQSSI